MPIFSASTRSVNLAANTPLYCVYGYPGTRYRLLEMSVTTWLGGSQNIGLYRPQSAGTPIAPTPPANRFDCEDDTGLVSTVRHATNWGLVANVIDYPTLPPDYANTNVEYIRRVVQTSTVGAGWIWTFPRGIAPHPVSGAFALMALTQQSGLDYTTVIHE